jgi:hypothetical protein
MKLNLKSETAAAIVAGAAFIASAGHIITVVNESNPWFVTPAYPIGIDGLIFVGIRAMQTGRKLAGTIALLIGAAYSLAFNAHAEGAITMSRFAIAASMPVCMFAAFLIEALGRKVEEVEPIVEIREVIVEKVVEKIVEVPVEVVKIVKTDRTDGPARTNSGAGRIAAWDVEKAVRLIADGRTNEDVAEAVGTNAKAIQRTRRALTLMDEMTDEEIVTTMKNSISAAHVARVRASR